VSIHVAEADDDGQSIIPVSHDDIPTYATGVELKALLRKTMIPKLEDVYHVDIPESKLQFVTLAPFKWGPLDTPKSIFESYCYSINNKGIRVLKPPKLMLVAIVIDTECLAEINRRQKAGQLPQTLSELSVEDEEEGLAELPRQTGKLKSGAERGKTRTVKGKALKAPSKDLDAIMDDSPFTVSEYQCTVKLNSG
jgi:hypothetical protein